MSGGGGFDLERAIRPALRGSSGYQPIDTPEQVAARYGIAAGDVVKLDGNENPYGPSPRALAAISGELPLHRYPDPDQRRLRAAFGERHGIEADAIVAGAGSDEIIDLVFRVFVEPGDRVVVASPTFGMYAFDARLAGAEVVDVPRREADWSLDADALAAAASGAKAVLIPSPNNPTGGLLPPEVLERLLALRALVVVDEAYIEFAGDENHGDPSLVRRAAEGDAPLIVLRTFSKWGGLAGMRVGYGVMPPAIAAVLMECKQPYGVSVASEAAALATLEDIELLNDRAREIAGDRDRLADELRATGWIEPAPSQANFMLCRVLEGDGASLREALRAARPSSYASSTTRASPATCASPSARPATTNGCWPRSPRPAQSSEEGPHERAQRHRRPRDARDPHPRRARRRRHRRGEDRDRHRLLRPHAGGVREARPLRPRAALRGRPPRRRAPHHGGRRARARLRVR